MNPMMDPVAKATERPSFSVPRAQATQVRELPSVATIMPAYLQNENLEKFDENLTFRVKKGPETSVLTTFFFKIFVFNPTGCCGQDSANHEATSNLIQNQDFGKRKN